LQGVLAEVSEFLARTPHVLVLTDESVVLETAVFHQNPVGIRKNVSIGSNHPAHIFLIKKNLLVKYLMINTDLNEYTPSYTQSD